MVYREILHEVHLYSLGYSWLIDWVKVLLPTQHKLEMWANAQRDGRPAKHRWSPLFNAAKFGSRRLLDAVQ